MFELRKTPGGGKLGLEVVCAETVHGERCPVLRLSAVSRVMEGGVLCIDVCVVIHCGWVVFWVEVSRVRFAV